MLPNRRADAFRSSGSSTPRNFAKLPRDPFQTFLPACRARQAGSRVLTQSWASWVWGQLDMA